MKNKQLKGCMGVFISFFKLGISDVLSSCGNNKIVRELIYFQFCAPQQPTVKVFSPVGPTVAAFCVSLSGASHRHRSGPGFELEESGRTSRDFISCSQRLPGDQMLWFRVFPFRDRFRGPSSSRIKEKLFYATQHLRQNAPLDFSSAT